MQGTDLATPFAPGPSLPSRRSNAFLRLAFPIIIFASSAMLFAAPSRAQDNSQTNDQDVAAASRQERARKDSLQKKSPHVYTEEDLKHAQILTPDDHAQVEAKKISQPAPPTEKSAQPSQQSADANSLPPDAPLGDVARHFRQQKLSQKLQQSAQFHLPVADSPALASPQPPVLAPAKPSAPSSPMPMVLASPNPPVLAPSKPSLPVSPNPAVRPLQPRPQIFSQPIAPHFAPYRPPVKRSPFERPKFFTAEPKPPTPSRPAFAPKPVAPNLPVSEPQRSLRNLPATQPKLSLPARAIVSPALAIPPRPFVAPNLETPVHPIAPIPAVPARHVRAPKLSAPKSPAPELRFASPSRPSVAPQPAAPHYALPIPKRLASPSPALELKLVTPDPTSFVPELTAPPKPSLEFNLANPSRPIAKSNLPVSRQVAPKFKLLAPSRPAAILTAPSNPPLPPGISSSSTVLTIKRGDSLWKLAKQNLGSPLRWRELLSANPSIRNPNLIRAGSQIILPPANSYRATTLSSPPSRSPPAT